MASNDDLKWPLMYSFMASNDILNCPPEQRQEPVDGGELHHLLEQDHQPGLPAPSSQQGKRLLYKKYPHFPIRGKVGQY